MENRLSQSEVKWEKQTDSESSYRWISRHWHTHTHTHTVFKIKLLGETTVAGYSPDSVERIDTTRLLKKKTNPARKCFNCRHFLIQPAGEAVSLQTRHTHTHTHTHRHTWMFYLIIVYYIDLRARVEEVWIVTYERHQTSALPLAGRILISDRHQEKSELLCSFSFGVRTSWISCWLPAQPTQLQEKQSRAVVYNSRISELHKPLLCCDEPATGCVKHCVFVVLANK